MFNNETTRIATPSWIHDKYTLDNTTQTIWQFIRDMNNIVVQFAYAPDVVGRLRGGGKCTK